MTTDFRDAAFFAIHDLMREDENILIATNDMGAMGLDEIQKEWPDRVVNVGIAEQNLMSVAGGLAMTGYTVFVYGIASHITTRCYEQIKLDIAAMNLPVVLIAVGAGLAYGQDGPTHHAINDIAAMMSIPNVEIYNPSDTQVTANSVKTAYKRQMPAFVRLDKEQFEPFYPSATSIENGFAVHGEPSDVVLITTGINTREALKLLHENSGFRVIDMLRLRPFNEKKLVTIMQRAKHVITLEEHAAFGGIGTIIAELIAKHHIDVNFQKFALAENFYMGASTRQFVTQKENLMVKNALAAVI